MSGVKEEVISSDEMRKRLYKTFKNRGVLDTLKASVTAPYLVFFT